MVLAVENDTVDSCFPFSGVDNGLLAIPEELFLCYEGVLLAWLQGRSAYCRERQ